MPILANSNLSCSVSLSCSPLSVKDHRFFVEDDSLSSPINPIDILLIDITSVIPSILSKGVASLCFDEKLKVDRFKRDDDRKRSAMSLLLQHYAIEKEFECSRSEYKILRTREGKPYLSTTKTWHGVWNYNVSHHGKYVALASSPTYAVGVDIVEIAIRKSWTKSVVEYIDMFSSHFTPRERSWQTQGQSDHEVLRRFFINWSLKEAYIKAIGLGLQVELGTLDFFISSPGATGAGGGGEGSAALRIDNTPQPQWSFLFRHIDPSHIISVALSAPLQGVHSLLPPHLHTHDSLHLVPVPASALVPT
jgi:4'-phosphopantetheinyl transferase